MNMTQTTTERIVQAAHLMELVHRAEEHLIDTESDEQLRALTNSVLSILVLHLRNRSFRVTIKQAKLIALLQESLG